MWRITIPRNYDSKHFDKKMPHFCSEMLYYFKEVRSGYPDVYNSEFSLWNNKEITIESKSIFWKYLFDKGIILYRIYLIETVSPYLWKIYKGNIIYN